MEWINEKAKTLKQGAIRAMFDRANTITGVISLGIGEPDMPTPKLVCEACKEALDKGITHYMPNAGTLSFRQAIAEKSYLKDLHYDPNTEIIITNGGMGALSLLFLILLNKVKEAAAGTRISEPAAAPPAFTVRLFSFETLDSVIRASRLLAPVYRGANTLYKDESTGMYILALAPSDHSANEFNKICNMLSEYSSPEKAEPSILAFLEEHCDIIVSADAVQKLSAL